MTKKSIRCRMWKHETKNITTNTERKKKIHRTKTIQPRKTQKTRHIQPPLEQHNKPLRRNILKQNKPMDRRLPTNKKWKKIPIQHNRKMPTRIRKKCNNSIQHNLQIPRNKNNSTHHRNIRNNKNTKQEI